MLAGPATGVVSGVIQSWRHTTATATALVRPSDSDSDSWRRDGGGGGGGGVGVPTVATAERRDMDEFTPFRSLLNRWMRASVSQQVRDPSPKLSITKQTFLCLHVM